ncbi:ABC transporter permease [Brevibacillus halotolerans]|uniref:ABC transporter permease n=1 Tax=Brevibacillus TaxID=55080 RepID=UPI00215D4634|nr:MULTISPECIES: ABC transporter permease [Brevibacillus]MCR8962795.1 ABC transporter permease [Brevibacillus laterosporus]MCZ0834950.1 ABC transporter permease [Brevibacillus halotolerans]
MEREAKIHAGGLEKDRHIGWVLASVGTFLLLWEASCRLLELPAFILPAPSLIAVALWELRYQLFTTHLWITLQEALLGLVISIIVGTGIAICMHLNEKMKKIMYLFVCLD